MTRPIVRLFLAISLPWASGCDRSSSTDASSLLQAGRDHMRSGRIPAALETLERAKRADPKNMETYLLRSKLMEQSGNMRGALDEALAAHRANPSDRTATLRALYTSAGMAAPRDVEALARQAASQSPGNPDAHLFLGDSIVMGEDSARYSEAMDAYLEANRLSPFAAAPLLGMGKLYLRMGDPERGAAMLEHAVRILEQAPRGPMPIARMTRWVEERRIVAFALSQAYSRLGKRAESRNHAAAATKWSRRASELRSLKNRASAQPPDSAAGERLATIQSRGARDWPQ